jgi:hypothetical protein
VHELCDSTGTYPTDIQNLVADCVEHRPRMIEHSPIASHAEREGKRSIVLNYAEKGKSAANA